MRGFKLGLALVVALGAAPLASAQSQREIGRRYSQAYKACMKDKVKTPEIRQCIWDEQNRQDVILNTTYRRLVSKLPPGGRSKLKSEQSAWIKYSKTKCENEYNKNADKYGEGTMYLIIFDYCNLDEKIKRRDRLSTMEKMHDK